MWCKSLPCRPNATAAAYLGQVGDQVEGNLSEGIVDVATDHVDPVGAVAGVAVRAVQAHHVGQVGECGGLLISTYLGYLISRLLTEGGRAVKVLDEVGQEAQDVERETCKRHHRNNTNLSEVDICKNI